MTYEEALAYLTPDERNHGTILFQADKVREALEAMQEHASDAYIDGYDSASAP